MKRQKNLDNNWSHKHDYPEDEIWQTGHVIAQFIATRLRAFRSYEKHGYSGNFPSMEKWNIALDKMVYAFDLYAHGTIPPEEQETFQEGLDLFHDNFFMFVGLNYSKVCPQPALLHFIFASSYN